VYDGADVSRQPELWYKTEILSLGAVSLTIRLNLRDWPGIKAQNAEVILYTIPLTLLQIVVHTKSPDSNFKTRLLDTLKCRSRSLRTTPFRSASSLSTTPEPSQNSMTTAEGKRLETIDRDVLG